MKTIYTVIYLLCFISIATFQNAQANNPVYEQRRADFITTALANENTDVITIQAYKGVPVNQTILTNTLNNIAANTTADFDIVKLIRVLCLSHGEYDSMILPVLRPIPFWLENDEDLRVYWSENHMIMWMSSDWILHEKYGKVIDSTLDKRLRHFLKLKIQYGFYEFFSSVYSPYTLSGLLNLADFSEDAEIKDLATQAAQKLLKDILMLANDKGTFFPAAGRNYVPKYQSPYGQNHSALIYLLTGKGQVPANTSHASGFLASSTLPVDDVINSWTPDLNTIYSIGHTLQDGISNINNTMSSKDKVIFQWSSGAYFDPLTAYSTANLIKTLNLWDHSEFADFSQFSGLPLDLAVPIAEIGSSISKSSGIYNQKVAIFKNKSVTLSSIQDFWKGKNGYQQFPVVANSGTNAVFTISGKPTPNLNNRPELHANIHLPYVKQTDNVALVMYRPEKSLGLFGFKDEKLNVALYFQNEKFDEVRENGNWILGREGDSYVAVRRNCIGDINGIKACDNPDGQTWIIMVGNIDMYGSFDAFQQKIATSQYEEKWYFNLPTLQWVYYAKIVVDGKTLEYAWNGDIFSGPTRTVTAISSNKITTGDLAVYPNPARDVLNVDLTQIKNMVSLKVINELGQEMLNDNHLTNTQLKTISTINWSNGLYILQIETKDNIFTQKFIVDK